MIVAVRRTAAEFPQGTADEGIDFDLLVLFSLGTP